MPTKAEHSDTERLDLLASFGYVEASNAGHGGFQWTQRHPLGLRQVIDALLDGRPVPPRHADANTVSLDELRRRKP